MTSNFMFYDCALHIGAAKMRFCPFFAGRCGVSPLEGVAAGDSGRAGEGFPLL